MARQAGRGFILITAAKFYFLLTATFATLAFPRLFGDPVLFGRYRVVSGLLNVVTMVVITATVQAVSKLASEVGAGPAAVRRTAFRVQTMVFGPIFAALFVFAGPVASEALHDQALAAPIRVASLVILAYTYYAVYIGTFNGLRRFGAQAGFDAAFSTLKTVLMVVLVLVTGSVTWTFGGFAAAAFLVLGASAVVTAGLGDGPGASPSPGRYLRYLFPLALYALVLNLLLQADVVGIKAVLGYGGAVGGLAPADAASFAAGVYGAAKNVATIPYQAVISLTFVVFPFVSRITSAREDAGGAVSGAVRTAAILSCAAVSLLGAGGGGLLGLLFGEGYEAGGAILWELLAAVTAMALMYVGNAILVSAGRPLASIVGGGAAVVVQLAALWWLLPGCTDAGCAWSGAADATLAGSCTGAAVSLAFLFRVFGAAPWAWTLLVSTVSAAASLALSGLVLQGLPWPAAMVVSLATFVAMVFLLRGVGAGDVSAVRRALAGPRG